MDNETATPAYSALFVIGDSLSDNGAVFALTEGGIPPTTLTGTDTEGNDVDFAERGIFYNQRFTNGDVYADVAVDLLGIASDTSTIYDDLSGSNVAVGGATATDLSAFGGTASTTYADQVATLQTAIAALPGSEAEKDAFLSQAAVSVFIGLNDLGALGPAATTTGVIDQEVVATGVNAILAEYTAQTQAVAETGVGTVILNLLPSGSFFPSSNPLIDALGAGTAEAFDQVSAQVNAGIRGIGASLVASGITVEVVDFYSLAREVQADQETFGFLSLENALPNSNATNTLLIPDVPIDQIGFIDPVHFTAELHEVFGAFQAKTLGNAQIDGDESGGITNATAADDTVFAQGGNDRVRADAGDDLVFGGAGNDVVFGGEGHDITFGGTENDVLFGEEGQDILSGGAGNDILLGGSGDDVVAGNAGNDFVNGSAGNDVLLDGLGSDVIAGGSGNDIAIYRTPGDLGGTAEGVRDLFFGGTGEDTLLIVSDTAIDDVDAFLLLNGVQAFSFETIEVITASGLETYDFGTVGSQVEMADLFGLV